MSTVDHWGTDVFNWSTFSTGRRRPLSYSTGRRRPSWCFFTGWCRPSWAFLLVDVDHWAMLVDVDRQRCRRCRRPFLLMFSSRPKKIGKSENRAIFFGEKKCKCGWCLNVKFSMKDENPFNTLLLLVRASRKINYGSSDGRVGGSRSYGRGFKSRLVPHEIVFF